MRALCTSLVLLAACGGTTPLAPDDVDARADGGPVDPDGGVRERTVRFLVLGDQGTGKPEQWAVAAAAAELCAREGCDFAMTVGDNLYYDGVNEVTDPIWQQAFELPYAPIDVRFHVLLGNHDYGPHGSDPAWALREVAYSEVSRKWSLPARHYSFVEGPVGFVMFDSTALIIDELGDGQRAWWPGALAAVRQAPWVIAAGHHPYRSNGHEGNAEEYGPRFVSFMDDLVCGHVDLYLSGHAHDREWFDDPSLCGGTELIVNGASGEVDHFATADTQVRWHDDSKAGFLYVIADEHHFTGRFVDADGVVAYEHTLTK
jgi:hypothetical protein